MLSTLTFPTILDRLTILFLLLMQVFKAIDFELHVQEPFFTQLKGIYWSSSPYLKILYLSSILIVHILGYWGITMHTLYIYFLTALIEWISWIINPFTLLYYITFIEKLLNLPCTWAVTINRAQKQEILRMRNERIN